MALTITADLIEHLRRLPKQVVNPRARDSRKEKHTERNYKVSAEGHEFTLYLRQSVLVSDSFSCGLVLEDPGGRVTLTRYNGSDHPHLNPLEHTRADLTCHIHVATERYVNAGRKPEQYAEATTRYSTLPGALRCLLLDWNITGIEPPPLEQSTLL